MKRILVTGATGFVGSHVVDLLVDAGAAVRAFVRPSSRTAALEGRGIELARGSLFDDAALEAALRGIDAIVHLAALTHAPSEAAFMETNAEATRHLARAARLADPPPRRLVLMSSLAAAGPSFDGRPIRPTDPPRPITAYGRSKEAAERACRDEAGSFPVVILRAPAVYGPRDRELLRFFRLARAGIVPVPTGPPRPLQFVHASDLARAILLAATHAGARGTFHIAEPRAWAMPEVVRLIGEAIGRRVRAQALPAPIIRAVAWTAEAVNRLGGRTSLLNRDKAREFLAPGWLCETAAAREAFGFETRMALPDGLRETAAWYRENGWLRA